MLFLSSSQVIQVAADIIIYYKEKKLSAYHKTKNPKFPPILKRDPNQTLGLMFLEMLKPLIKHNQIFKIARKKRLPQRKKPERLLNKPKTEKCQKQRIKTGGNNRAYLEKIECLLSSWLVESHRTLSWQYNTLSGLPSLKCSIYYLLFSYTNQRFGNKRKDKLMRKARTWIRR